MIETTTLLALYINIYGASVPVTLEVAPIVCAHVMQDFQDQRDPRVELANGETSPPLTWVDCVEGLE